MKCVSIQIALFFESQLQEAEIYARRINQRMGQLFDGKMQILNLPKEIAEDIPVEIPIVQWLDQTEHYQLSVSKSRCDLHINVDLLNQTSLTNSVQSKKGMMEDFIGSVLGDSEKIIRMGVIVVGFEESSNAPEEIIRKYFTGTHKKIKEISFRINQESTVEGYEINNILDVTAGDVINEALGINDKGIIYQRDINNVVNGVHMTLKSAKKILAYALSCTTNKKMGVVE